MFRCYLMFRNPGLRSVNHEDLKRGCSFSAFDNSFLQLSIIPGIGMTGVVVTKKWNTALNGVGLWSKDKFESALGASFVLSRFLQCLTSCFSLSTCCTKGNGRTGIR